MFNLVFAYKIFQVASRCRFYITDQDTCL